MAQPDINSILAALAQQHANGTGQVSIPQQSTPAQGPPSYPPGGMATQSPSLPQGAGFSLPQPSSTGSMDLSGIKPVSSGSVSIADAIAKARGIAADRGMASHDLRQNSATPRDDPRRNFRSRSRSPARRDSYGGGNPYRDERREDPARGRHRRSPSDDRNFRGSRDPPANHRGNNEGETETISVKSNLVGLVIGRNGENMRKIESDSGARVQFIQAKDSRVSERMCTISGPLRARMAAKDAIFSIIRENAGPDDLPLPDKGSYSSAMGGRSKSNLPTVREGESSSQLMVPDKTVGLIIGRGGETIKDLQEKSGCHINILPENKSVNGLRPINLIGNDQATETAKDMIYEIVESDTRGGQSNGGGGGGASGSGSNRTMPQRDRGYDTYTNNSGGGGGAGSDPSQVKKTIEVPSEAVGMIIGKGGETIKELQKSSGCSINVNQPQRPDITRKIDLSGPAHAVREAERTIWEKVETVRQRDAQRGGGPPHQGGGGRDNQQQQYQQQYDPYSSQQPQQQQQQPAAMPSYAQYLPGAGLQQTQQQMPTFQMPAQSPAPGTQQQQQQQQASDPNQQNEQYAAAWAQYYAQQFAQLQQQQQNGGGAPGT